MFDHWTLKKRLTLTFAALLVVATALIAVALTSSARLREAVHWNAHTYKVLNTAQDMLLNMVNIETGLRGFVAGGNEKFLEPYNGGLKAFETAFAEAKTLTSDNPAQQGRLDSMLAAHKQFMAVAQALVTLRREATAGTVPVDTLLREFGAGKDKLAMDAFRTGVADFMQAEQTLLDTRSADLEVVSEVRSNSESVATASARSPRATRTLSGRTEQQASALQQTAATMEELGTTVRHNADSAAAGQPAGAWRVGRGRARRRGGGPRWSPPCRASTTAAARSATSSA
jgi:CHASE3 domain sensor protein